MKYTAIALLLGSTVFLPAEVIYESPKAGENADLTLYSNPFFADKGESLDAVRTRLAAETWPEDVVRVLIEDKDGRALVTVVKWGKKKPDEKIEQAWKAEVAKQAFDRNIGSYVMQGDPDSNIPGLIRLEYFSENEKNRVLIAITDLSGRFGVKKPGDPVHEMLRHLLHSDWSMKRVENSVVLLTEKGLKTNWVSDGTAFITIGGINVDHQLIKEFLARYPSALTLDLDLRKEDWAKAELEVELSLLKAAVELPKGAAERRKLVASAKAHLSAVFELPSELTTATWRDDPDITDQDLEMLTKWFADNSGSFRWSEEKRKFLIQR